MAPESNRISFNSVSVTCTGLVLRVCCAGVLLKKNRSREVLETGLEATAAVTMKWAFVWPLNSAARSTTYATLSVTFTYFCKKCGYGWNKIKEQNAYYLVLQEQSSTISQIICTLIITCKMYFDTHVWYMQLLYVYIFQ